MLAIRNRLRPAVCSRDDARRARPPQASSRMALVGEVGYKSDGFVRGELLRAADRQIRLTLGLDGAH